MTVNLLRRLKKKFQTKKWCRRDVTGLNVLINLFKVIGLFPCAIDTSVSLKFFPSRLCVFHHVALIVILGYFNFFVGIPAIIRSKRTSGALNLGNILELIYVGTSTAIVILIWIVYILFRSKLTGFGNRVVGTDAITRRFGDNYQLESVKTQWIVFGIIYLIIFNFFLFSDIFFRNQVTSQVLPSIILLLFVIQYTLIVQIMRRRVRALNKMILRNDRNPGNDEIFRTFESWREAQDQIYEAGVVIADFYSFPILFVMGLAVYGVVYNSYYLLKHWNRDDYQVRTYFRLLDDAVWIAHFLIPIVLLVVEIDDLLHEVKEKAVVCRKLLVRYQEHQELRCQIKKYLYELLHENINFTAFGFFLLNRTVLHSMFATTVTYLVLILYYLNPR
ncbi:gustatory receptor 68a-like [Diachasmimorpha longicaudata]|uniref:gustatory receptor 68a-like n=1 Tax=Diachasmimorpha longicaudata TaxID=58733 RepID=UPI0030B86DEF